MIASLSFAVFAFLLLPAPLGFRLGAEAGSAVLTGVAAPDAFALASSKCPSPVCGISIRPIMTGTYQNMHLPS